MTLPVAAPQTAESVQFRATGDPLPKPSGMGMGLDWYGFHVQIQSIIDELPGWWSPARDRFLRQSIHDNTLIAGVVYGESVRVKNMPFRLIDETKQSEAVLKRYQTMLQTCNFGTGLPELLHSVTLDLLTQDNGAFIELIGDDRLTDQPLKGEVKTLAYMDAAQCWRTYDPEYPVVYMNPYTGKYFVFHYSRVVALSNFRQGQELARGLGLSALSRSYEAYRMLRATNTYVYEKLVGQSPEIYMSNVPVKVLENAFAEGQFKNDNRGFRVFKDHVFVGPKNVGAGLPDAKISKVGLREAPLGFDQEQATRLAMIAITAGFGVDVREYFPAVTTGATKADAEIQDIKAEGKGISDIINTIENTINWRILPPEITFKFEYRNHVTERREAEARLVRVQARQIQVATGELNADEARILAAESGDIDPAFLERQSVADGSANMEGQAQAPTTEVITATTDQPDPDEDLSGSKASANSVRSLVRGYWNGTLSRWDFIDGMQASVQRRFTDAWEAGAAALGMTPREIPSEGWRVLSQEINNEFNYITGFADAIMLNNRNEGGAVQPLLARADMWLNADERIRSKAMAVLASKRVKLKWKMNPLIVEHCDDCNKLNGRVYYAQTWKRYGIEPGSRALACHGYNCGCGFEVTDEPVTPGNPPEIEGLRQARRNPFARLLSYLGGKAAKYDSIDFTPPEAVRSAFRSGLEKHEQGLTGNGLESATVAWARRLAAGEAVSPEKARQGNRWFGRNSRFADLPKDSPGYAAWLLWGGAAGKRWFASLVNQMDTADKS